MSQKVKQRNSSIELLRIIAMFIIVMHHYCVHGLFYSNNEILGLNKYILDIGEFGQWAVNIFIIIFGYFGIKSKFKLERILRLYVQVWFYSVILFLAYTIWNKELHIGIAVRSFFPIIGDQYWFFGSYIVLCFLSRFLNKMIENITKQSHLRLIMILLVSWSVIPSIIPVFMGYGLSVGSLGAFVLLYIIGAYLRLYPDCKVCQIKNSWIVFLSSIIITLVYKFFDCFYSTGMIRIDCFSNASIISIGFAVAIFCIFNKIDLKSNKIINEISMCTFGIYLIHDNERVRYFLWHYLVRGYEYQNSPYLILHMLLCANVVFICCLIIEFIRRKTIDKLYLKYVEKRILSLFDRIRNMIKPNNIDVEKTFVNAKTAEEIARK